MTESIDTYIAHNQDRFIEELTTWLRFPSVSAQRSRDRDTLACAQWLTQHFADLGLDADLVDKGGRPIILARSKAGGGPRVTIYGHYDVQPEDPVEQWHTDPFKPVIRDGVIYARGATDDKGQVFAHVKAVETLLKTQGKLPCEVVFILEGEEESGGDALGRYVRSEGKDLRPQVVIISDGEMYDARTPAITYGLRGILTFEMTVQGPKYDLHSGAYGGSVANPALVLAQILSQCVSQEGKVLVPNFYDEVASLEPWERDNIQALQHDEQSLIDEAQVPGLHGEPGYSSLERLWARPTFEINGIYGGYQGQGSKTIIPASAAAKVSIRLVPDQDPDRMRERVFAYLRSLCPDTVTLTLKATGGGPPVLFDTQAPALQAARDALRLGFAAEPAFIRTGGSIPVVSTFADQWNCPVILMGLGLDSDGAHGPNEHFSLDSFISVGRHAPAGCRDLVGGQDVVDFCGRKTCFPGFFGRCQDLPTAGGVRVAKRLHFADLTGTDIVVVNQGRHGAGRFAGQGKARHPAVLQNLYYFRPLASIRHQVADNRFFLLFADCDDFFGRAFIVHKKRRDEVDKDTVEIFICHHGVQTGPIMLGRAGGQDINRIVDGCFRKQSFGQYGSGLFRKRRPGQTGSHHHVRGNHRRAAGIGDDSHPIAPGNRLGGEGCGSLNQLSFVSEG